MTTQATPLKTPPKNPNNVEAKKYYTFNETGNIMMATTDDTDQEIQQSVRDVFAEVAVFFAAMTRAISTTPNPDDHGKPYSIYNYSALERVIDGSGLFVHVTEEDVEYKSSSWGAEFSKELIEALLGLATGAGGYLCRCSAGWSGADCATQEDPCVSSPCGSHARSIGSWSPTTPTAWASSRPSPPATLTS